MKARPLLKWAGILCAFAAVSVFCIEAGGADETTGPAERPDVIRIETLAAYGKLELPPVAFPHDTHSDAVKRRARTARSATRRRTASSPSNSCASRMTARPS